MTNEIIEDILKKEEEMRKVEYDSDMCLSERQSIRRYLTTLLSKARPGNWAWRKLETRFGFDGDVSMYDYGEPEGREFI
jgi:hypothetical protein